MNPLKNKLRLLNEIHSLKNNPLEKPKRKKKKAPLPSPPLLTFADAIYDTESFVHLPFDKTKSLADNIPCLKKKKNLPHLFDLFSRNISPFWPAYSKFKPLTKKYLTKERLHSQFNVNAQLKDLLFMDIETCGFLGSPLFLIGIGYFKRNQFYLEQFFAQDYSQEFLILEAYVQSLSSYSVLVTYNGKRFDVPFLKERTDYHLLNMPNPKYHLDLLWESRKKWKGKFPNFKLQTLEQIICLRKRWNDLPGSEIPNAYLDFVSNPKEGEKMQRAIHHNALDVITMVEILTAMLAEKSIKEEY